MSANTLQIDLPNADSPSVWPWMIALVAGAAMLAIFAQKLRDIPQTLQQNAQQIVSESGLETVAVSANGRDLTLSGTVPIQQSVATLFAQLEQMEGVRLVRDELTVIDPVAQAAAQTQSFLQALARIDTASVTFQAGSASFTASSDTALDQIAGLMNAHPETRIRIEGHTDDTGPETVNLRISRQRAQAVANYLANRGISDNRLIAKGYGSTQPLDAATTEAARSRNRRIEISYVD